MNKDKIESEKIFKGVLFDLDGVLVDSETEYTRIWNKIDKEFPTGIADFARKIKGTNLDDILTRHFPDPVIREKVIKILYEEEGKMKYRYCDGAKEVLETLRKNQVPIALYTSSNHKKMEHLRRDIPEIEGYFNYIVLGDMVSESKPSSEGYIKASKGLGLEPEECIVVEDSLQGVIAGERCGGGVIGVSGTLESEILEPHCNIVINSMRNFPYNFLGL